jgi:hypothetical protein
MGIWLTSGLIMGLWSHYNKTAEAVLNWMFLACLLFTALLIPVLGERDAWGPRVRRTIPCNKLLRLLAFLVYTGSAGGILWCSLMFGATLFAAHTYIGRLGPEHETVFFLSYQLFFMPANSWLWPPLIVFGYLLSYCLAISSLRKTLLKRVPAIWLPWVAAGFALLMNILPCLAAFFAGVDEHSIPSWWLVGGPLIVGEAAILVRGLAPLAVLVWLIVCVAASLPWFNRQWVRFIPYPEGGRLPRGLDPTSIIITGGWDLSQREQSRE